MLFMSRRLAPVFLPLPVAQRDERFLFLRGGRERSGGGL